MIKSFILALQFLTRLPIPIAVDVDRKTIAKGTYFYPFVGTIIGLCTYIPYLLLYKFDKDIASIAAVLAIVLITGGFHLDGLADTCDGFFSSRKKEKILEIMKDSRVGTFGAVAIFFDLLTRYVVLSKIPTSKVIFALVFSIAFARLTAAFMFSFGKSARKDGLGAMVTENNSRGYYLASVITFIPISFYFIGKYSILIFIADLLFAVLLMIKSYKTIDGLTGDVYGTCSEVCEIIGFLIILCSSRW